MLPIPDVSPGCVTTVTLSIDHTRWPPPGTPDPSYALEGISLGIELPQDLTYVAHTFDGTYLKAFLGGDPEFGAVKVVAGGVVVGIVPDLQLVNVPPEGTNQTIITLYVRVRPGTPPQTLSPKIVGFLGDPTIELLMVMPIGTVLPVVQNQTVKVLAGTCAIQRSGRYHPAAVGHLPQDAGAGGLDTEEPADTTDHDDFVLPEAPEVSDPDELHFEEPTEEELIVEWLTPEPDSDTTEKTLEAPVRLGVGVEPGLGVESLLIPGSSAALSAACGFEARIAPVFVQGGPPTPTHCVGMGFPYATISAALVVAAGSDDPVIIEVAEGTYLEAVVIDPGDFPAGLTIFATDGPEDTTIDPPEGPAADNSAFTIEGAGGMFVHIGLVEIPADILNDTPSTTGWLGFNVIDGDEGGVVVKTDAVALVTLAGNIIQSNVADIDPGMDPADPVDLDDNGGGVFVNGTGNVLIWQNHIHLNGGRYLGGGIRITGGATVAIVENWILGNFLQGVEEEPPLTYPVNRGGGVGIDGSDTDVTLCSNPIKENVARQGSGIYCRLEGVAPRIHIEACEISDNTPWPGPDLDYTCDAGDGYRGAGIAIDTATPTSPVLQILNNSIHDNTQVGILLDPCDEPPVGGGIFLGGDLGMATEAYIVSNLIYSNTAIEMGGGIHIAMLNDDEIRFLHNTIVENVLDLLGAAGSGITIVFDAVADEYPLTEGINNIVFSNTPDIDRLRISGRAALRTVNRRKHMTCHRFFQFLSRLRASWLLG